MEGRSDDVAGPLDLVARAKAGRGGTWWVEGEPGVGKTTLLDAVVAEAGPGVQVLRTVGREAEAGLAWAGLQPLTGPLREAGHLDRLPRLVTGNEERAGAEDPLEPYAVLVELHRAVVAAAVAAPVLLVVDDVQWLDDPSRLAVEFLASRLEETSVAMLVAGRPRTDRPPVPVTPLLPLPPAAADRLLETAGVEAATVRRRLVDELGGNPLLLRAAASALDPDQRTGAAALPAVLPIPHSALQLAERRLAPLGAGARTALLVLSVLPTGEPVVVHEALGRVGATPADLEEAEQHDLVSIDRSGVRFTHPSIRSAVFHGVRPADRRAAHLAVAATVTDPAIRAWHLGLGQMGPDDAVAAELEEQARVLRRRADPVGAARYLELAARHSSDPAASARQLRLAADAVAEVGHDRVAEALLDRADATSDEQAECWNRHRLRLQLQLRSGAVDEPVAGLRALADEVAPTDPGLSSEILLDAMAPLVRTVRAADLAVTATTALERAVAAGDGRVALRAEVALGVAQAVIGEDAALDRLARYQEVLDTEGAVDAAAFLAEVVAPCLAIFHRAPEVEALFAALDGELRAKSAMPALIAVLSARAIIAHRGHLPTAMAFAGEAVALADDIGRPALATTAASSLVIAAALIGDCDTATTTSERLIRFGEPGMTQHALAGLGILHLGTGALDQALATYQRLADEVGVGVGMLRWEYDWSEALLRARRRDEAVAVLDAAGRVEEGLAGRGGFTRARAMLTDDLDEALALFETARDWFVLIGTRIGEGRTELAWGERLRRARRRAAARDHLERAVAVFDDLGATIWAERARHELEAAGGPPTTSRAGVEALTRQELEIARRAAIGATNQEIAEAVFLSPRTVETHLGSTFRKLGIRNRRQLAALAVDDERLRP